MGLVINNLTKSFGKGDVETKVLKGIDMEVDEGGLVILKGASGSGKTTLLSIIGGLLGRSGGEVTLNGENYLDINEKALTTMRLREIGFIFQSSHLIPYMKVIDQLAFVGEQAGMRSKDARQKAEQLLREIGLGHRLKAYPNVLSGGEKQRVAIMRAWMNEPKMILADEPTASLDAKRATEVMGMIRDNIRTNNSVGLMITHDERLFDYADRIYTLDDGHVVAEEKTEEKKLVHN
ncbi:MAG TPA: ABC transporter ATP-binding protein [Candidatus Salinicoccus stercoripullorum]|uniref:ABC transporter ATP-binding protein n=1 Tax=Candidatus Salinicoccus stercoripullorum TaxID=2838756 RepID=A0A9D1QJS7_9STAP|nr:ABC transporter ATP-binding protein [Candidatus Salinicoccus stercoripullorum]